MIIQELPCATSTVCNSFTRRNSFFCSISSGGWRKRHGARYSERMAFPAALDHGQQLDYTEEAGGLGDIEPEPAPAHYRGRSGSKRGRAIEERNISKKRRSGRINKKMTALHSNKLYLLQSDEDDDEL